MKEYQIQKDRKRVLPSEVYYQCLWVVKDMNRLQEIAGMEFRREMLAEDFNVLEAEDGRECMAQLETYGADISLVLLDMIMPEMDGLQVLEEMNKRGFIEDIPVIIITADGSEEKVRQAYDMGVSDYIERPFDIRIVRQRVMNTVKLYARQRRLAAVQHLPLDAGGWPAPAPAPGDRV